MAIEANFKLEVEFGETSTFCTNSSLLFLAPRQFLSPFPGLGSSVLGFVIARSMTVLEFVIARSTNIF